MKAKNTSLPSRLDLALKSFQVQSAMVLIGYDSFLTKDEVEDYQNLVVSRFHGLLVSGGADIHPKLYGEEITHAGGALNLRRDTLESQLIKKFFHHPKRTLHGFCRGHQLIGVSLGAKLIQDIHLERPHHKTLHRKPEDEPGFRFVYHSLELSEDSKLSTIMGGREFVVNSYHHQALDEHSCKDQDLPFKVVGQHQGIIEAIEFESGFSVQFHPEYELDQEAPERKWGKDIFTQGMIPMTQGICDL